MEDCIDWRFHFDVLNPDPDRKPGQINSKMNLKLIFGQGSGFHPIRTGIWENFRDLVARLSILTDRQID